MLWFVASAMFAASLSGGFILQSQQALAATNSTLNFQARLENSSGSIVPDGTYNVEFKIYTSSTVVPTPDAGACTRNGGTAEATCLWTERYYDSNGVTAGNDNRITVQNGYLTVNLGSQTAFPSTINWDQDLWVVMNIGGTTQTSTPTWDGEMTPRLKLTGVPYAFKAGQLATFNSGNGFTSTLSLLQPTVGNQVFQIADQGAAGTYTLCVQTTGCTPGAGSGNYIQNQNASAQTTSNFWISGSGRADTSFLAPAIDAAAAGTFSIGLTNATTIQVGKTTGGVAQTINIGTNDAIGSSNTINIGTGATNAVNTVTIGTLTSGSNIALQGGNISLLTSDVGMGVSVQNITSSTSAFSVQDASATTSVLNVDTVNGSVDLTGIPVVGSSNAGVILQVVGAIGGDSSTGTAGVGGAISLFTGNGGAGTGVSGAGGGAGGLDVTLGNGGDSVNNVGGGGGGFNLFAGTGGSVSGSAAVGGPGGQATMVAGNGGIAAGGGTSMGGAGGTSIIMAGAGGAQSVSAAGAAAGIGGDVGIAAGEGGAGTGLSANGNGGNILLLPGAAGTGGIGGTAGSVVITNSTTNSAALLRVQNAQVVDVLTVDTSSTVQNLLLNPAIDKDAASFVQVGTGIPSRTTTAANVYAGTGSLQVALGATANSGVTIDSSGISGSTQPAGTYTLSFYAKGGAALTGLAATLSGGGTCTLNSTTVGTAGFQRYYCTVTTVSATTSISIKATTTNQNLYLDNIQLQTGGTLTPYAAGGINLLGAVTSPVTIQGNSNSTEALAVLSAAGINLLNVDSTNSIVNLLQNSAGSTALRVDSSTLNALVSNGSFEKDTSGWVASGTGASIATTTAQKYIGNSSLQFVVGSTAGNSARLTVGTVLTTSTTYTFSFYVKGNASPFGSVGASYAPDGTTATETDCAVFSPSNRTATNTAWTRFTCTINTPSTAATSSAYVAIKTTTANNQTIFIDAVQIEAGSSITTGLITNTGFEGGATGWTYVGTPGSAAQSALDKYNGTNSLRIVTTTSLNDGAKFVTSNSAPTQLSASTSYTMSFWAKSTVSSLTGLAAAYAVDGTTERNCTLNNTTVLTTSWQYFTCTFTTINTPVATSYVIVKNISGNARTFFIDDFQITKTTSVAAASGYYEGAIGLNGIVNSPSIFKNQSNSTTAFQIQNAAGASLFTVDTANTKLTLNAVTNVTALSTTGGQLTVSGQLPVALTASLGLSCGTTADIKIINSILYCTDSGGNNFSTQDVSNPAAPVGIGTVSLNGQRAFDIIGRHAFVTTTNNTLQAIDISNPAAMSNVSGPVATGTNPTSVKIQGKYAYVTNGTSATLQTFDISNPAAIVSIGTPIATGASPSKIFIQGRYLYIITDAPSMQIFDLVDPASPVLKGTVALSTAPSGLYVQDKFAYVTSSAGGTLQIINVVNPASPVLLTTITTPQSGPTKVMVQNHLVYVLLTNGLNSQVEVYDVSAYSIASPVVTDVGASTTIPILNPLFLDIKGRHMYVVGGGSLVIYDLGGTYSQAIEGGGLDVAQANVKNNLFVGNDSQITGGLGVGRGAQISGGLGVLGNALFTGSVNTATAFQVQNVTGQSLLQADTTNATNLITNSGFDTGVTGYANVGTGTTTQNTTAANVYSGTGSLQVTLGGTANSGTQVSNAISGGLLNIGTYAISFYAKGSAALTGLAVTFGGGGTCTLNATTVSAAGFQRYSCVVTTTGTTFTINITATTTAQTLYLDNIQLQTTSASPYNIGGLHLQGLVRSPLAIQTASDSTSAFQVWSSGGTSLLAVDSLNSGIVIGSATTDTTEILLQLDSFSTYADAGTCSATVNQGALYYNTNTNAIRSCVNAAWEDVVTTAGLGLLMFGIVPDSGATNPGDLAAAAQPTTGVSGPCKVTVGGTTATLAWTGCTAYTGGRKQIIAAGSIVLSGTTAGNYHNLCVFSAGSAPTLGTGNATEASAQLPTFSVSAPNLCLATIRIGTAANTIREIDDARIFTTSVKSFATVALATNAKMGGPLKSNATAGQVVPTTAQNDIGIGILNTWSGTASTTTPNAVIITNGPAYVRLNAAGTIGWIIETDATGFASGSSTLGTGAYSNLGIMLTNTSSSGTNCAINTICSGNVFTHLALR